MDGARVRNSQPAVERNAQAAFDGGAQTAPVYNARSDQTPYGI